MNAVVAFANRKYPFGILELLACSINQSENFDECTLLDTVLNSAGMVYEHSQFSR